MGRDALLVEACSCVFGNFKCVVKVRFLASRIKKNDRKTILISTTTSTTHDFRKRKTILFPIMEIVRSETILVSKTVIAKKVMFKAIDLDRKNEKEKALRPAGCTRECDVGIGPPGQWDPPPPHAPTPPPLLPLPPLLFPLR